MKNSIALLAVAGAFCLAPAHAEIRSDNIVVHSKTVRYADLDLTRAGDRALLDRRIDIAVRSACGSASSVDIVGQKTVHACREILKQRARVARQAAIADAMTQPSAAELAASER
ncbi:MAG: UrcA family protein [Sphingobium sp.]